MAVNYTAHDYEHKTLARFDNPEEALDYARARSNVSYVERNPDGLVIARRNLDINPVWEKERR